MKIARVEENWMTMKEKRNSSAWELRTHSNGETKDVANSNELKIINEKNYNFSLTQSSEEEEVRARSWK
jgi:hypothetical protein